MEFEFSTLDRSHDRSGFSCGVDRLDNFLRRSALKQQKDDYARVFVAHAPGDGRALGFYALNAHSAQASEFDPEFVKRAPPHGSIGCIFLSMVAVDSAQQGKGLGRLLMIDAMARACITSDNAGTKMMMLDVIPDGGEEMMARRRGLYESLGFTSLPSRPERMFMTMASIKKLLGR